MCFQSQSLQLEQERRLASNYALAKQNLPLKPCLENGRTSLAVKYQELQELREMCREKQQHLAVLLFHLRHTQVGKLQESLLSEEKGPPGKLRPGCERLGKGPSPELPPLAQNETAKLSELCYSFTPALRTPSADVIPFPVPGTSPKHHLPPMDSSAVIPKQQLHGHDYGW
uniref:vacuolar protein sorting-associated protein 37D-like n=1 Tax=Euleptes europaea TaxID=460621 RepID=UPI0025422DF5|nr:vacuolar protein sorting-associated protein 37D-like [Euleptes europaea]